VPALALLLGNAQQPTVEARATLKSANPREGCSQERTTVSMQGTYVPYIGIQEGWLRYLAEASIVERPANKHRHELSL
jgi:hypothetical protein